MSTYYDGDLEVGRFDLIHVDKAARPSVDVNLVLHVVSTDDEMFARKLVEGTVAMCGGATPHVRLKAYVADFNSLLVYVSDTGMQGWRSQLTGCETELPAARQHYSTEAIALYRSCMREYATQPFFTHEVSYTDGSAIYFAGE
jgi:hypothetical protein